MDWIKGIIGAAGEMDADNEDTEHTSGIDRLCGSIFCALCGAPICMLGAMFLLGWNEQQTVCNTKKIAAGLEVVQEVGCTDKGAGSGELVLFSCDIKADTLPLVSSFGLVEGTDFSSSFPDVKGPGFSVSVEMYQCVESTQSETKKDSVGGGTTTKTTYTYSKAWQGSHVNTNSFAKRDSENFRQNCGYDNPPWPAELPRSGTNYAQKVDVGEFSIPSSYIGSIRLNTPVSAATTPPGWTGGNGRYESDKYALTFGVGRDIGKVRVSFNGYDKNSPLHTVLGENDGSGAISRWTAPDSWLCSGWQLGDMRAGKHTPEELFSAVSAGHSTLTFILRIVGFLMLWFAWCCLGKPLEVAADCVPCIGPCLGDSVSCVITCVSCLPATMCAVGVAGCVWVAMRPVIGIPLMVLCFLICCFLAGFKTYSLQNKMGGGGEDLDGIGNSA